MDKKLLRKICKINHYDDTSDIIFNLALVALSIVAGVLMFIFIPSMAGEQTPIQKIVAGRIITVIIFTGMVGYYLFQAFTHYRTWRRSLKQTKTAYCTATNRLTSALEAQVEELKAQKLIVDQRRAALSEAYQTTETFFNQLKTSYDKEMAQINEEKDNLANEILILTEIIHHRTTN